MRRCPHPCHSSCLCLDFVYLNSRTSHFSANSKQDNLFSLKIDGKGTLKSCYCQETFVAIKEDKKTFLYNIYSVSLCCISTESSSTRTVENFENLIAILKQTFSKAAENMLTLGKVVRSSSIAKLN